MWGVRDAKMKLANPASARPSQERETTREATNLYWAPTDFSVHRSARWLQLLDNDNYITVWPMNRLRY